MGGRGESGIILPSTADVAEFGRAIHQMSILTKGLVALGSIIVTVVITKVVEQWFELTFFSSAVATVWAWLGSAGSWLGRDVSLPFWGIALLSICTGISAFLFLIFIYTEFFEKAVPARSPLTPDQAAAFVVVGRAIEAGCEYGLDEVQRLSGLSRVATQSALDNLYDKRLICPVRNGWGNTYLDLTSYGREYFLELESSRGC